MEGLCDVGETRDPSLIEVHKSDEFPNASYQRQILPFCDDGGLLFIHFEPMLADIHTKKLDFRLMELTFLWVAKEVGFPKTLECLVDSRDVFL